MIEPKRKKRINRAPNSYKSYKRKNNSKPKTAARPGSAKKKTKGSKRSKTSQKKQPSRRLKKIGCDYFDEQDNNIYNQF